MLGLGREARKLWGTRRDELFHELSGGVVGGGHGHGGGGGAFAGGNLCRADGEEATEDSVHFVFHSP